MRVLRREDWLAFGEFEIIVKVEDVRPNKNFEQEV